MNKKAEFDRLKSAILIVFSVTIIIAVILLFLTSMKDDMIESDIVSTSESFFADNDSAQTLAHTPSAWTSATTDNNSWLSFDGVNDYVDVNSGNKAITSNATYSFWFNSTDVSATQKVFIINNNLNNYIGLNGGNLSFNIYNTSATYITYGSNITYSEWLNIILTASNNGSNTMNFTFYINGVFNISSSINSVNTQNYDGFILGGSTASGAEMDLDEFRFYNRTLDVGNITQIYNSGRVANSSLPTDGLILWLPLNENTGTDVHSFNQSDF